MKRSKFTEEQIAFALKQQELGTSVDEVCRKMGISEATFYVWKKKYSGVGPSELRRLRQLEEENRKLKQIVAEEFADLRSQSVISSAGHGGRRTAPYAFTEQGVAMLSSVLGSPRAVA